MPRRRASPDTAAALHDQGAFRATAERRSGCGAARAGTKRRAVELNPAIGGPCSSRLLASVAQMEAAAADAWSSPGAVPHGRRPSLGWMELPPRMPACCSTPSPRRAGTAGLAGDGGRATPRLEEQAPRRSQGGGGQPLLARALARD
nr:unnamed protein product [Digitaria exilis]